MIIMYIFWRADIIMEINKKKESQERSVFEILSFLVNLEIKDYIPKIMDATLK